MSEAEVLPELSEIIGAILFAAKDPVPIPQILAALTRTAERYGGASRDFAQATEADVLAAMEQLKTHFESGCTGIRVLEISNGFRLENLTSCGPWVREFLEKGKSQRLSQAALETLAIIAYRQPILRAEIEAVRGVAVDQIVRNLLDLQLIRITGRSEAPGRPWMFGTTQKFLEHFGLRCLDDLPGVDELKRIDAQRNPEPASASNPATGPLDPARHSLQEAFIEEEKDETATNPDSAEQ